MPCFKPLAGWRASSTNANGRRPITFNAAEAWLDRPQQVACGQCLGCKLARSQAWALRLQHERQLHDSSVFATLTYNDNNIPPGGTLVKRHFQDFIRRLRKAKGPLRYFHCGEYGELTNRPHYHAILFGVDFPDKIVHARSGDDYLYISHELDKIWGHGHCTIGAVTFESAAYVARYCVKKITGPIAEEHYRTVDRRTGEILHRTPEYVTMSLRPAIAAPWFEKYHTDVYPSDFLIANGKKTRVPRYYDKLLERRAPELLAQIRLQRIRAAAKRKDNNTPERLEVRETVARAKLELYKRDAA